MKRYFYLLLFALLLPWTNANAQTVSAEKLWFGEYKVSDNKEIDDPSSPTGKRFISDKATLSLKTDNIIIRNQLNFGFGYIMRAPGRTDLEHHYYLPDETGRATTNKKPDYLEKRPTNPNSEEFIGWYVGPNTDLKLMKPGLYIFQVRHGERVLAEQWFNVQR